MNDKNNLLTYGIIALVVYLFIQIQEKGIWGSVVSLFGGKSADKDVTPVVIGEYKGVANYATISKSEAEYYAGELYDAMKGFQVDGTRVNNVWTSGVRDNAANLGLIYNAFGKKELGKWGSPIPYVESGVSSDLMTWIRERMNPLSIGYWEVLYRQLSTS